MIAVQDAFVFHGTLNGRDVKIFKGDGCITNVVSRVSLQESEINLVCSFQGEYFCTLKMLCFSIIFLFTYL